MWDEYAMRASWVVIVLGVGACSAPAPEVGVAKHAQTQEAAVVGEEIATDPPILQPADVGHAPVVASDGNGFLAVQEVASRIRAVRVDATGKVLDSPWLDLGEGTAQQYYPSVAFGGGHYLVTWSAFYDNGDSTIEGRFVKPNGDVEGTVSLPLASSAIYPSVGWNGTRFQLSYLGLGEAGSRVAIESFEADGTSVPNSAHWLSAPGSIAYPRLAVNGTASLVAWESYVQDDVLGDVASIRGARVDASGAPDPAGELQLSPPAQGAGSVSVAAGSDGFLAVWQTNDSPNLVLGSVVSVSGAVATQGFTISHSSEDSGLPSVAFDGSNYLVAWADGRDEHSVYGNRVSPSGVVASTTDVKLATGAPRYVAFGSDRTALAWSGSHFLLSFLGEGVEGSLIAPDLSLVDGQIPLTGVPNKQGYPTSVWDGQNYLVVWTDERNSDTDMEVRGMRIGGNGQVLDPEGISLSNEESPAFGARLASTRQGSSLAVWFNVSGESFTRTIASDGTLGAVQPFRNEALHSTPGLASNGAGYLASRETGDWNDARLIGSLLDVNGTSGPEFELDSTTSNTTPVVFQNGADYLVSYSNAGTWLMPVSGSGVPGEAVLLAPSPGYVTAASSGADGALVVWSESNETRIHARFFRGGELSGATLNLAEASAGYGAAVVWDGSAFWAVWETPEHLLEARRIGADGTLGAVATWVNEECFAPVLSSDGQGQLLLSYSKYGEQSQTRRVFSRLVNGGATEPQPGTGGSSGAAGNGNQAGSGGNLGGQSSGGSSAAGSPSTGGSSSSAGASGSGSGPTPSPQCSLSAPGSSNVPSRLGLAFVVLAAALLRRKSSAHLERGRARADIAPA
ncbi:MAG: exported protein with glycine-rich C-terminal domain [Polyangiaceae bacterium]|jgi:hypothetical protein|nr:exported protein with glycine-rich C-terminal domain [Polyangiaceae bacterium]